VIGDSLINGLSALVGAFLGAFLTRQSQYHKWVLEQRAVAFSEFLCRYETARERATDILVMTGEESTSQQLDVLDAYHPMLSYAKVVRLYLPEDMREEFTRLANEVWALHSNTDLGDKRLNTMEQRLNRIQDIFESSLKEPQLENYCAPIVTIGDTHKLATLYVTVPEPCPRHYARRRYV